MRPPAGPALHLLPHAKAHALRRWTGIQITPVIYLKHPTYLILHYLISLSVRSEPAGILPAASFWICFRHIMLRWVWCYEDQPWDYFIGILNPCWPPVQYILNSISLPIISEPAGMLLAGSFWICCRQLVLKQVSVLTIFGPTTRLMH